MHTQLFGTFTSPLLLAALPPAIGAVIFIAFMGLIILIGIAASKSNKARKEEIAKSVQSLGLAVTSKPEKEQKAEAFSSLGGCWSKLNRGAGGVNWYATGSVDGKPMTLVEHSYVVSTGKSSHTVYHTVAAIPAPANWPTVEMSQENLFHKIAEFFGSKDYQLEDEEFNKRWRIKVGNDDFALMVLTPEVQAWSMNLPTSAIIRIGSGAITIAHPGALKGDAVKELLDRCATLAGMIPPELAAWQPSSLPELERR